MKKFLVVLTILAVSLAGGSAFAASIKVDDDTFASFGTKARIRLTSMNPGLDKVDVTFPEGRIYFSGQVTNTVKFGFNYDFISNAATGGGGRLTDGFITLDLAKELKIMTGVYRMAVTRVALQDSYQYILISGPDVAGAGYLNSNTTPYRGEGVTVWGDLIGGKLRYNVGFWDGDNAPTPLGSGITIPADSPIGMSARVVFNFLDPEKGYACPGCYLGKAQVFNVGVGLLKWDDLGTAAAPRDYSVVTVDAFYDANGLTAEGGFFQYDYDNGQKPKGIYAQAAYVLMDKIQPAVRFETWDDDAATTATDWAQITAGVHYLFDGHAAKVGLELKRRQPEVGADTDTVTVQLQVQF